MTEAAVVLGYRALAWRRLKANRPAMAALIFLGALAIICIAGPFLTTASHDRIFPDYVRVPASLTVHPEPERIEPALARIAQRMRATVADISRSGDVVSVTLVSARPLDKRNLALFSRSDLFGEPEIVTETGDGRRFELRLPVERHRFVFGTDGNGRDLLARMLIGGRISLAIGLLASLVALVIGVSYGAVSGYLGGQADMVMMRIVDVLYALPFIFFVILLVTLFGRNFLLMFLAVGAVEWLDMARIARGQTLMLKRQEFVQAAEAMGVATGDIIRRHIIPNLAGPVIVFVTLLVPKVILIESFLSFLGLGVQEPLTSLGVLIAEGAKSLQGGAYLLVFPGAMLSLILLSLNILGDGLRDAFDPKER